MMETISQQQPPRRVRGRRETKVAYRNTPEYSGRSNNASSSYASQSPEHVQFQGRAANFDYFDAHRSSAGHTNYNPVVHQDIQDTSWLSLSLNISSPHSYTLATNVSNSPHAGNYGQSPGSDAPQMFDDGHQEASWNIVTPRTSNAGSEMEDLSMSDMDLESFANSMMFSASNTAASSSSHDYVFPMVPSAFDTTGSTTQLHDLILPEEFHQIGQSVGQSSPRSPDLGSPLYPTEEFHFESAFSPVSPSWGYNDVYPAGNSQWSAATMMQHQSQDVPTPNASTTIHSHTPWNSEIAQGSSYQLNANSGHVAFEPFRGISYDIHVSRQDMLDTRQNHTFVPEAVSPTADSETSSWVNVSYSGSCAASHGSPVSNHSPPSHPSTPPRQELEMHHSHIFNSMSGPPKPKALRGRQRGLTAVEKKQARDVREAKACWACHISKTKCSPCKPGTPCEQCARLANKRRFCLFSCFNDPLESLTTFLVPSYLMGHFTEANVESFVTKNASSWGTQYISIRMDWGYSRHLQADVVALALRSSSSEMGFHHQTISTGNEKPLLVKKESPPLGIPLAAMGEMQKAYSQYVQDIVQHDVGEYIPAAYIDRNSGLPTQLLGAIASYYNAGRMRGSESELLCRAIEMHVTSVILERSLFLDADSLHQVQHHLGQEYPRRSAPRCAQRQIKLAFFLLQQRRIESVLKNWGNMMWATNPNMPKDKEWAIAFGVFLTLILVMDKTLGAAYYFCEGRIKHHGHQESSERAEFRELVRLTQKQLFERCKEIFHWKFKTRKGGKEACNPIRDGAEAFEAKSKTMDPDVRMFVGELRHVVNRYEQDIRPRNSSSRDSDPDYTNPGRLVSIFLDDFLSH